MKFFPEINFDGVWNLVLACQHCNRGPAGKFEQIPTLKLLERLHARNNFFIDSHHPLRETLIAQSGKKEKDRISFLQNVYNLAITKLINQKWAADISYIWTREGWLYLAVILDLHSRRVIGWAPLGHAAQTLPGSGQQSDETRPCDPCIEDGHSLPSTTQRLHPSHRSWQPILLSRLPEDPAPT